LSTMQDHAAEEPLRATVAITNGQEIWAARCASDARSPSLYYGSPRTRANEKGANPINTIASEPMDGEADHWHRVDAGTGIHWTPDQLTSFDLHL
jgi:glutamine amidotransferase